MKKELTIFLTAIMFFTRIPCPKWIDHSGDILQKCTKYFSMIGVIVGCFGALVFWVASYILPLNISILLSYVSTIWITGAFHEDGFADVCDGFGGGWTKDKILAIMKDSLVGTYGIVGLICLFTLKLFSLFEISNQLIITIIAGHSVSRCLAAFILYLYPYARTENSKSIAVANNFKLTYLIFNIVIGFSPLLLFKTYWVFLAIIPPFIAMLLLGRFFKKWIGGQTGDCAGATQQITEVIFYLSLLVLWRYI
ncbi:adenosylcobinamide-GDP ribazoletransferase [Lutibacter holmesii]|uniref:Adenosylcobinamide-GDP ribazoletransferase n=1 Tax=Lutibacter holmesii TaxID=1137985 RepID=A0ABW3WPF9_9FLAO